MNINQYLKEHPRFCTYGAPMGDRDWRGDPDGVYKFHLQRLRFVDGDYALDGTYWGAPANVYCAWDDDPEGQDEQVRMFVRADSRSEAKRLVLVDYPNARFYR